MESYQKLKLVKEGNHHELHYENKNNKIYRELNDNEFENLFNKIRPNIDFSLPDKLIQNFVKDGSILPSFKNSLFFTNEEFNKIVEPLKEDLPYMMKIKNRKKNINKRKNKVPHKTMKNRGKKNEKINVKNKLLKKLNKPQKIKKNKKTRKEKMKKKNKK